MSAPFWVLGLVLVLFGVVGVAMGVLPATQITNGRGVWAEYLALALVFPPLAIALVKSADRGRTARIALTAVAAILGVWYAVKGGSWVTTALALIGIDRTWNVLTGAGAEPGRRRVAFAVAAILTTLVGWTIASTLSYNVPLGDWIFHNAPVTDPGIAAGVFVAATVIVMLAVFGVDPMRGRRLPAAVTRLIDAVMIALIAVAAARRDAVFPDNGHLSFFVGPVEMVRQGGWLLWDVPSQYGFGNMLLMAALPFGSSYADEFVLNALLMFLSAAAIYTVFRLGTRSLGPLFAAALAIAAMFLVGGAVCCNSLGPEHYPSIGPMRFFWCYALGSMVVASYLLRDNDRVVRRLLIAGSVSWALSALWSAESAIYGSCIWLPFLTLTAIDRFGARTLPRWLGLQALLLFAEVTIVELVYWAGLGHGPDWLGLIDYGLIYQGGFGSLALDTLGAVWVLVLSFCVLCTIALVLIKKDRLTAAAAVIAACGLQWSTASYFIMRSHPNNVLNLLAVDVFALGIGLLVAAREELQAEFLTLVRAAIAPVFIVTIALGFSATGGLAQYASPFQSKLPKHLRDQFVEATPQSVAMFQRFGLKPDSPILYGTDYVARVWPQHHEIASRVWIPAYPPALLGVLGTERALVYLNRFEDRRPMNGYILRYTNAPVDLLSYAARLETLLANRYFGKVVAVDGNLQLEYYTLLPKERVTPKVPKL